MAKPKKASRDTVTYLVWWADRQGAQSVRRLTVPASWKLTLAQDMRTHTGDKMLRMYEGALQRACLSGVLQFCDEHVKVLGASEYEGLMKLSGQAQTIPLDSEAVEL